MLRRGFHRRDLLRIQSRDAAPSPFRTTDKNILIRKIQLLAPRRRGRADGKICWPPHRGAAKPLINNGSRGRQRSSRCSPRGSTPRRTRTRPWRRSSHCRESVTSSSRLRAPQTGAPQHESGARARSTREKDSRAGRAPAARTACSTAAACRTATRHARKPRPRRWPGPRRGWRLENPHSAPRRRAGGRSAVELLLSTLAAGRDRCIDGSLGGTPLTGSSEKLPRGDAQENGKDEDNAPEILEFDLGHGGKSKLAVYVVVKRQFRFPSRQKRIEICDVP
jgi:hypothetical protein